MLQQTGMRLLLKKMSSQKSRCQLKLCMYPIQLAPDNDVKKPFMFVFMVWEDYQKNVDVKYNAGLKRAGEKVLF